MNREAPFELLTRSIRSSPGFFFVHQFLDLEQGNFLPIRFMIDVPFLNLPVVRLAVPFNT